MKDVYIVLDNVRSALNVGAIFRTCDGLGVKELILVGITPYPPHQKILKTALGANEFVQWKHFAQSSEAIEYLKEKNVEICSVEITDEATQFNETKYAQSTALVFGHEITGVSMEFLQQSDKTVFIPMQGVKHSLNVATTVGIITSHVTFAS